MDLKDVWVLEYSPLQGAFHVEELWKSIAMNTSQANGRCELTGYLIIFAGTKKQCHAHGEAIMNSGINLVGRNGK